MQSGNPRLEWLEELAGVLGQAADEHVATQIKDHVDPLKKLVYLMFQTPIAKNQYKFLQIIIHGFAKANDCVAAKIKYVGPRTILLEILTKYRSGPAKRENPLR